MPDDVILNTSRAFSGSSTSVTGYERSGRARGTLLRAGEQCHCIQIKAGDCAPESLLVAPFLSRFDIG